MKILGISALDKDATASLVIDGEILFAAAEERYSRKKQHAGFPHQAIRAALEAADIGPEEIDAVTYPFLDADGEIQAMAACLREEAGWRGSFKPSDPQPGLRKAEMQVPERAGTIHGLGDPNRRMRKGALKEAFYGFAGFSALMGRRASQQWLEVASRGHRHWQDDLLQGLQELGLSGKLRRLEHHLTHAAGAYLASGFDRALVVTLDGYGTGLAGSVSLGEGGELKRLKNIRFPDSLGTFYETVTSSLGYNPDRHAGKIVGLAAYGDPEILRETLLQRFDLSEPGTYSILDNLNVHFSRHLAARLPMVDVAAAYQEVLEIVARHVVSHWVRETDCDAVVLAGGVTANVKMNQRIHEVEGVERIFVYPNMGDGGTATGGALHVGGYKGSAAAFPTALLGPDYSEARMRRVLDEAGVPFWRPADLAGQAARFIHEGQVIARFDGRMEYGPRALGARSILYHAREPEVNHWLNTRLGRTEFMPFAPVTLWEAREKCYLGLAGAEESARFMTITFDCTDWMIENCPAAVHVDGTARPQLVRREENPGYYDIVKAYEALSGIPCLINTSFNMHEEPIVRSPEDALRAFLLGGLDYLVMGPFLVARPGPNSR